MRAETLLLVAGAVVAALLIGCQPGKITRSAQTANALLALRADYDTARQALTEELDRLPPETAAELEVLAARADRLVADVTRAWADQDPLLLSEAEAWLAEGRDIYETGRALVTPHLDQLSPRARAHLAQLDRDVQRIEAVAAELQQSDYAEYARAAVEIATLALRIAVQVM